MYIILFNRPFVIKKTTYKNRWFQKKYKNVYVKTPIIIYKDICCPFKTFLQLMVTF
jgi:hypothetical protein